MKKFVRGISTGKLRRLLFLSALVSGLLVLSIGCGETKSGESKADAGSTAEQSSDQGSDQGADQSADHSADKTVNADSDQAAASETKKPAGKANHTHSERKSEPKAPAARADKPKTPKPKAVRHKTVEIPAGTYLVIELQETLETGQVQTGDHFRATLIDALVISDRTVFEAGAPVTGLIEKAVGSGRLKTDAELMVSILEIDGIPVSSDIIGDKAASHADRNKKLIGGGAIVGGIIGAIKGKNIKGALTGAAAGAAAGTGAAVLTGKKNLKYEPGTILEFELVDPVKVEVKK